MKARSSTSSALACGGPCAAILSAALLAGSTVACGREEPLPAPYEDLLDRDAEAASPRLPTTTRDHPCHMTEEWPRLLVPRHVNPDIPIDYSSSPATSGPHFAYWGKYKMYEEPLDPRVYVHNLEHGAIAIFFKCDAADGKCPAPPELAAFFDSAPPDPGCAADGGAGTRVLVAPTRNLDVPIAAAAWGHLYKAACFDDASLRQFFQAYVGRGPEHVCE